ncbi:MAG: hypothetical protein PVG53_12505 [Holophagae bacterium]|jgi:hypothetical protein
MKLRKSRFTTFVAALIAALLPVVAVAGPVSVPSGTRVFIELDDHVTSKKKKNPPGTIINGHAWRDVVVNGRTVVEKGAPVVLKIGEIKSAKVAGIKGHVELEALQVEAVDGSDLVLTGGYDQSGKGRMALSISLGVFIFPPLVLIKGKQAKLEPGTVFDATVAQPAEVDSDESKPITITIASEAPLEVTIPYDEIEAIGDRKLEQLPLRIRVAGDQIAAPRIVEVNENAIDPIDIQVGPATAAEGGHMTADATVDLKQLAEHFTRGINRFTVRVGDLSAEVMLDLEL